MVKFIKVIPIAVKTGTVTIKYPYEQPLTTSSFRGIIEIDPSVCTGCGACIRICPSKALSLTIEGEEAILRYFIGRCIFCGMCADICPEKAIKVTKEFELASKQLSDLYVDVEHEVITCKKCGAKFSTKKLVNKTMTLFEDIIPESLIQLCPRCRRIEILSRALSLR